MPTRRPACRLLAGLLTAALPALLPALLPAPALAAGGNLNTSAFLENRGWINPSLVPPPASGSAVAPGKLASEAWYLAPPGQGAPPWQVGAAGFARAEVLNGGTWNASVQQGTAALARAVASATGRAEATLSAQWQIDVVLNPLQVPLLGLGLYTQLMTTLGCPVGSFISPTDCSGPERGFSFLHLTQGAFQVTPGQGTGRASFEETVTLSSRSNAVTLQGGASYSSDHPRGSLGITWSGGWSAADAAAMAPHDGSTARLYPAGDPRNALADPFGTLTGVRLEALRPLVVSSGFQVGLPHYFAGNPLPFARFTFELEQVARAGWALGYGFGTMAANFDDTAVTRLLGIEGLALTGADGEPVPLAGLLQVHLQPLSPVPEPASALMALLGVALLLAARRPARARAWALPVMLAGWMGAATAAALAPGSATPAEVVVNGRVLDAAARQAIEGRTGVPLQAGRWWYDARSGLWGAEGQGAAGFAPAGIDVGAPLPPQASGGRLGVFFNGRNLADAEIAWLRTLGPVWPGRYWLDAMGNVGLEGQALPFANLALLARARRGGAPNGHTRSGTWVASDGGCVVVSGKSSSGIGSFGASTC